MTFSTRAYAAHDPKSALRAHAIQRRDAADEDVVIDIAFCGVCHSDLHQARDEWHDAAPTEYPCVLGHEIVGMVREVGANVQRFERGDRVAVGRMVDACRTCANCLQRVPRLARARRGALPRRSARASAARQGV